MMLRNSNREYSQLLQNIILKIKQQQQQKVL